VLRNGGLASFLIFTQRICLVTSYERLRKEMVSFYIDNVRLTLVNGRGGVVLAAHISAGLDFGVHFREERYCLELQAIRFALEVGVGLGSKNVHLLTKHVELQSIGLRESQVESLARAAGLARVCALRAEQVLKVVEARRLFLLSNRPRE